MSFRVTLEIERGDVLDEVAEEGHLEYLLPPDPGLESEFPLIRYVDPYGDTIFNELQMEPFLREWAKVKEMARGATQRELVERIEAMARRCAEGPHLYLKFWGD